MAGTPVASIILPLEGAPVQALRCLQGLALQADGPDHEVIIVDDAAIGLERLLASLEGDVEIVRSARRAGFSAAARLGVERARGQIIVLIRGAATPTSGWLQALIAALDDPAVGLAASVSPVDPDASLLTAWSVAFRATEVRVRGIPVVPADMLVGALALSITEQGRRATSVPASAILAPGARTGMARRTPGEAPELTVVIPTLDATSERVRACVAAVQATADAAHEIVIVDNGAPPQGFAAPVNAGLRAARAPYVVVMNDDVEPLPGWWLPLRAAIDAGAAVAFPLTIEGGMRRDFAAWCFAMGRDDLERFSHAPGELFDPSLVIWYQDTDLLHRLSSAGRLPVLVEESRIRHGLSETVGTEDAELSAWIRSQIAADQARFQRKHPGVHLAVR
ncbi:MAG: glycosyltransferase family 2 protein [Solirubrobacteraceae bacterium]